MPTKLPMHFEMQNMQLAKQLLTLTKLPMIDDALQLYQ